MLYTIFESLAPCPGKQDTPLAPNVGPVWLTTAADGPQPTLGQREELRVQPRKAFELRLNATEHISIGRCHRFERKPYR
ncbi:hypothetical protein EVAR_24588_1 [Eumeta japonica]|uniref:Uncharacterized protein n=1 Tax=Eumeta variegata TaxID=151549 RepID=A0A4C1W547_EUMVA|nr:hypothetical protein EVAR_24588_1 [Eumeta japonica]